MSQSPFLLDLAAMVRAGAVDHAWSLFVGAGLAASDDPAVLTLKGRMLKERARAAAEAARADLYRQAAAAYLAAAPLGGGAYALINAATLSLLAGDEAAARTHALAVLETRDNDTAYYQAATDAEALLVLRRFDEARKALETAIAVAPRAWEDHAVTLRQFRLLLAAMGEDDTWLSLLAPPRALHFAGHMAVAPDDATLGAQVARIVAEERLAFGYGALAAGADILVAEALVEAGVELHVLLPTDASTFRQASVTPWGNTWGARFDRLIADADSVQVVATGATDVSSQAIAMASETAMGLAVLKSASLSGDAIQLVVLDEAGQGASGQASVRWAETGRRQRILTAPRLAATPPAPALPAPELSPTVFVGFALTPSAGREAGSLMEDLARTIKAGPAPLAAPGWTGLSLLSVYGETGEALEVARSVVATLGPAVRVAGSYGLAAMTPDPFPPASGGFLAMGAGGETALDLLATTPPGAIHIDLTFAAALSAVSTPGHAVQVVDLSGDERGPYRLRV